MKIKKVSGLLLITICCLLVLLSGMVKAEINLGGKIESTFTGSVDSTGKLTTTLAEQVKLELLLPTVGDTSTKCEVQIKYEPQGLDGKPVLTPAINRLYIKQRFSHFHLTLGRQPISWDFGSLINPVDFAQGQNPLDLTGSSAGASANAVSVYIPLTTMSNLTTVLAYPEFGTGPKLALRARGELLGFDLALSYVKEPTLAIPAQLPLNVAANAALINVQLPGSQRLGLTGKGDLGPFTLYGAMGYNVTDGIKPGKMVYLIGTDYSFTLPNESKLMAQVEYLHDEARSMLLARPDLVLGTMGYEVDEFQSVSLVAGYLPQDRIGLLGPLYKNQIGKGLDLTMTCMLFLGDVDSLGNVFQTKIPRGMLQTGIGYTF